MLSLCYQPTRKFALAVLRTSNRGKRNFIVSDLIRFGEKYFCGQFVCVMMTNSDSTTCESSSSSKVHKSQEFLAL